MPYYGFTPQMKQTGTGIALAGQAIGGAIQQLPGAIRKKETYEFDKKQREEAITELENDWSKAGLTWKTVKTKLGERGQKLVDAGKMTQEELDADLREVPLPKQYDQKDRAAMNSWIERTGQVHASKNTKYANLESQLQTGERVGGVLKGQEAQTAPEVPVKGVGGETMFTEQDVTKGGQPVETAPAVPGPTTQEGLMGQMQTQYPQESAEDIKGTSGYEGLPSQAEQQKQKMAKKREQRLAAKQEHLENNDALGWARLNYKKTHDAEKLKLAEDKAKMSANRLIGGYKSDVMELDDEIKELKNPGEDEYGEPIAVDYNAIAELEAQKLNFQGEIDNLTAEKKQLGIMPGEKRTFSKGTGKETSRTKAPPPGGTQKKPLGSFLR